MNREEETVSAFNKDVTQNMGYLYTTKAPLSSTIANSRLTDAALNAVDFRGKRVIDIGCGDGVYTIALFDRGHPSEIVGVDPSAEAIKLADQKKGARQIRFELHSGNSLPFSSGAFGIAHLRGVLHHMEKPIDALRESFRTAGEVVVVEPNGYNVILKLIERFSPYHIKHGERSFFPSELDAWVEKYGGTIRSRYYLGLVPFFCPDWMAKFLKYFEPFVEKIPLLNRLVCAVYVFVVVQKKA